MTTAVMPFKLNLLNLAGIAADPPFFGAGTFPEAVTPGVTPAPLVGRSCLKPKTTSVLCQSGSLRKPSIRISPPVLRAVAVLSVSAGYIRQANQRGGCGE